jgi:predicted Rossmann fold nucleotide-binding protein DprA/Smf involved in DNA uptake
MAELKVIARKDPEFPAALTHFLGDSAPESITARGNLDILRKPILALFSSVRCPGDVILRLFDLAKELRKREITVISGFHTPMERECPQNSWCSVRRMISFWSSRLQSRK